MLAIPEPDICSAKELSITGILAASPELATVSPGIK